MVIFTHDLYKSVYIRKSMENVCVSITQAATPQLVDETAISPIRVEIYNMLEQQIDLKLKRRVTALESSNVCVNQMIDLNTIENAIVDCNVVPSEELDLIKTAGCTLYKWCSGQKNAYVDAWGKQTREYRHEMIDAHAIDRKASAKKMISALNLPKTDATIRVVAQMMPMYDRDLPRPTWFCS